LGRESVATVDAVCATLLHPAKGAMMRAPFLRVSAIAAVVGAVLALVGNLIHPRGGDDPDFEIYRRFAHSTSLRVADLRTTTSTTGCS
jgi:hypothetical protein